MAVKYREEPLNYPTALKWSKAGNPTDRSVLMFTYFDSLNTASKVG